MCGHHEHHGHAWRGDACGCGEWHSFHHRHPHSMGCCCAPRPGPWAGERAFWRRFATREERIAWLERYLQELRAEAQAVEERIAELKAQ